MWTAIQLFRSFSSSESSNLPITLVANEKIYFQSQITNQYIYLKKYYTIIFYIKDIRVTFYFFQYTEGWFWYSKIFQHHGDLYHMLYRKSVNIRTMLEKL